MWSKTKEVEGSMNKSHAWWATIGDTVRMCLSLSCWNPIDGIELRRSLKIARSFNEEIPFISVVISILCIKMEWYLYIIN